MVRSLEQPVVTQGASASADQWRYQQRYGRRNYESNPKPLRCSRPDQRQRRNQNLRNGTNRCCRQPTPAPMVVTPVPTSAPPPEVVEARAEPVIKTTRKSRRAMLQIQTSQSGRRLRLQRPAGAKTERRSLLSKLNPSRADRTASDSVASTGGFRLFQPLRLLHLCPGDMPMFQPRHSLRAIARGGICFCPRPAGPASRPTGRGQCNLFGGPRNWIRPYFEAYYNLVWPRQLPQFPGGV